MTATEVDFPGDSLLLSSMFCCDEFESTYLLPQDDEDVIGFSLPQ